MECDPVNTANCLDRDYLLRSPCPSQFTSSTNRHNLPIQQTPIPLTTFHYPWNGIIHHHHRLANATHHILDLNFIPTLHLPRMRLNRRPPHRRPSKLHHNLSQQHPLPSPPTKSPRPPAPTFSPSQNHRLPIPTRLARLLGKRNPALPPRTTTK